MVIEIQLIVKEMSKKVCIVMLFVFVFFFSYGLFILGRRESGRSINVKYTFTYFKKGGGVNPIVTGWEM